MAREEHNYGFYEKYTDGKWIDIHQSVKNCLEAYFAKVLFNNDLSRICYAQSDISFRRRIELLDNGKLESGEQEYSPMTLNLPYLSYAQTSDWENDDRPASKQTGQMVHGEYDPETYKKIRSRAVKATYTAQIFFDRLDDVRTAAQILNWEANPQAPILLYQTVAWKDGQINIPVFTTIEKINTNPQYKEKDWLEKRRIFPIEVELTVRSYEVLFDKLNTVYLPVRRYGSLPSDFLDKDDTLVLTNEVDMKFMITKFDLDDDVKKVDLNFPGIDIAARKRFNETPNDPETLRRVASLCPNEFAQDILGGYYTDNTGVKLDYYKYERNKSEPPTTTAWISFRVNRADWKYLQKIKILVPGHGEEVTDECEANHFFIEGLHPNSEYRCKILTYSINGDITTFNLTFKTAEDPDDLAPTPTRINKIPGLVGMHL